VFTAVPSFEHAPAVVLSSTMRTDASTCRADAAAISASFASRGKGAFVAGSAQLMILHVL